MILVAHELKDYVEQEILSPEDISYTNAVRVHIYRNLFPAGSLKVELRSDTGKLIGTSETVPISSIDTSSAPNNYFHGYVRFYFNIPLKASTTYFVRIVGVGYTFSESSYIGICNDFDLQKYDRSYNPNDGWRSALDIEFWHDERTKRR